MGVHDTALSPLCLSCAVQTEGKVPRGSSTASGWHWALLPNYRPSPARRGQDAEQRGQPSPLHQWRSLLDIPARSVTGRSLCLVVCSHWVPSPGRSLGPSATDGALFQPRCNACIFPGWIAAMAPPLLGLWLSHRLPAGVTSPTGWGEGRYQTNGFWLQPAPRGAATIPMQMHGVITPRRREIRHCPVPDKASQAVTHSRGIRAACCMVRLCPARTDV